MAFHAVLFDLDGTLLDSAADIAWAGNTLLSRHGYATHPLHAYNRFVGDGVVALVTRLLPESERRADTIARYVEEYRDLYAAHWNVESRCYPGIPELIESLRAAGLRLAVLSNKPHEFTLQCVDHFLGRGSFDLVLGAGGGGGGRGGPTGKFPNKPDPAAALHIARQLDLSPAEFLYLGDTDTDMQTATNAGMYAVGVLWGLRTREELALNGAKTLITRPDELLRLLPGVAPEARPA